MGSGGLREGEGLSQEVFCCRSVIAALRRNALFNDSQLWITPRGTCNEDNLRLKAILEVSRFTFPTDAPIPIKHLPPLSGLRSIW